MYIHGKDEGFDLGWVGLLVMRNVEERVGFSYFPLS